MRIRDLHDAGLACEINFTVRLRDIDTAVLLAVLQRMRTLYIRGPAFPDYGVCGNLARPTLAREDTGEDIGNAYDVVEAVSYMYPESWCMQQGSGTYITVPYFLEGTNTPTGPLWEGAGLERRKAFMRFMYRTLWDELVRRDAVLAADFEAIE